MEKMHAIERKHANNNDMLKSSTRREARHKGILEAMEARYIANKRGYEYQGREV